MIKLADKIAKFRDMRRCPPVKLASADRQEYQNSAAAEVAALVGTHPDLEVVRSMTIAEHVFVKTINFTLVSESTNAQ